MKQSQPDILNSAGSKALSLRFVAMTFLEEVFSLTAVLQVDQQGETLSLLEDDSESDSKSFFV